MKEIAIIGGGIGGLTAAYDLARNGNQVTIYEAAHHLGGLSAGFKKPDWNWTLEAFYHHWFQTDRDILGLIDELGLKNKVHFYRPKTVVYDEGNFYPLDSPITALLFPGFSLIDKARFGFVTLYLRYLSRWQPFEKFTAYEWLQKYYGQKIYKTLYEPLLMGKFSQYYQRVNMAWFWARFKARTTSLGTYEGGFQAFIDQFSLKLMEEDVQIKLNTPVNAIQPLLERSLEIITDKGQHQFDQVLVTTSPRLLAQMAPALSEEYANKLGALKSIGAVVLILSLKHQLSTQGYYWFNLPKLVGFPFLALVEHTNFAPAEYFGGEHIVYCGDYLDPSHEYFYFSKEELLTRFLPSLQRINPDFSADWVVDSWLSRNSYAQPVPFLNHSANIPDIRTPIPNLYFASMSQVYPWDRGTNFAVQLAHHAAKMMIEAG